MRAMTYKTVYRAAYWAARLADRVRAWAWTKIIAGWPPEVAADMLRNLDMKGVQK